MGFLSLAVKKQIRNKMHELKRHIKGLPKDSFSIEEIFEDVMKLQCNHSYYIWANWTLASCYQFKLKDIVVKELKTIGQTRGTSQLFTQCTQGTFSNWLRSIIILCESELESHQVCKFLLNLCNFVLSNVNTNITLTIGEDVLNPDFNWVFNVLKLIIKFSDIECEWYGLCMFPEVIWLILNCKTHNKEITLSLEVIEKDILRDPSSLDNIPGDSFNFNIDREGYIIEGDVKIYCWPIEPVSFQQKDPMVCFKQGLHNSNALFSMYSKDYPDAWILELKSSKLMFDRDCSYVSWNDLCGFHSWPLISGIMWTANRKKSFIRSAMYFLGCGESAIAILTANDTMLYHLPFLKTSLWFREKIPYSDEKLILVPSLESSRITYEINQDLTIPWTSSSTSIFRDSKILILLTLVEINNSCLALLLWKMYSHPICHKYALMLHPLTRLRWRTLQDINECTENPADVIFEYLREIGEKGLLFIENMLLEERKM